MPLWAGRVGRLASIALPSMPSKPKLLIAYVGLLFATSGMADPGCAPSDAFGVGYGSRPPLDAKLESKGNAANWYELRTPKPPPQFDKLQVRANSASLEILEVIATKQITPAPSASDPPLSMERRAKGREQAKAFVLDYLALLNPETRSRLTLEKYTSATWKGMISDDIMMTVQGDDHWVVTVSCESLRLHTELGRRILPELYQKPVK